MKLSKMNTNELREFASRFGADKKRLYGTSKTALTLLIGQMNKELPESWYLVRNGEILFKGTEMECAFECWIDPVGELEMYRECERLYLQVDWKNKESIHRYNEAVRELRKQREREQSETSNGNNTVLY